ncbi:MAG: exopolysaccharide biosynthesis polyprenyl glycosylphosphotransferase [Nitrososphaeria archaeon]
MTRKMDFGKKYMALIFFAIIMIIQIIFVPHMNNSFFLQAIGLDLLILIGIYAFRGFDDEKLKSFNATLVSYGLGSIGGFTIFIVIDVAVHPKLPFYDFFATLTMSILGLSFLAFFLFKILLSTIPLKRYLIIGLENEIGALIDEIQEKSMGKFAVYKYINPSPAVLEEEIESLTVKNHFDAILIGDLKLEESVSDIIVDAHAKRIEIDYLPNITEKILKRVPIYLLDKFGSYYKITLSNIQESPSKRLEDIIISSIALTILSPVFLILYIIIILDDGRPAIFIQDRIGLNNDKLRIHKFRSMKKDQGKGTKYVKDEKHRITKIGKIMRPIRLDEIPQFYDILIGKMSFVGPRPEQPGFVDELSQNIPYYNLRHKVKPGLTGWAQINYKYASTTQEQEEKLSYDLYYVKNRSIYLDLQILLKTIETVVFRKGAE